MAVDQVLERGGRLLDAKCVCLFMCLNFLDVHKTRWLLISWPQRAVQIGERRKKCWFLPRFVSRHFCLLLRRSSSKKCFVIVAINLLLDFSNCPAPGPVVESWANMTVDSVSFWLDHNAIISYWYLVLTEREQSERPPYTQNKSKTE